MSLHLNKGQIVVEMPWFVKYCQLCHNNYMIENTFLYQFIEIRSMAMSMSMSRANPFVVLKNMLALLHSSNLGHYLCAGLCLCPCLCLLWFVVGSSKLLFVGMGWNWVQGGDTPYVAVFSLSCCPSHIWQNLVNSFAKSAFHIYCVGRGKKLESKYHSNPLK